MYYALTMKRVNFHLSDLQISMLKKLSKKLDLSIAELIRRAIDDFLRNQKA